MMHMSMPSDPNQPSDDESGDLLCIHPPAVAAARARLAQGAPVEAGAARFALMADPTRLRLLTALTAGELCVHDLAAATGVNRTTVSHQLRLLREARLVRNRRAGRTVYYALDDEHVVEMMAMAAAHAAEEPGHDAAGELAGGGEG